MRITVRLRWRHRPPPCPKPGLALFLTLRPPAVAHPNDSGSRQPVHDTSSRSTSSTARSTWPRTGADAAATDERRQQPPPGAPSRVRIPLAAVGGRTSVRCSRAVRGRHASRRATTGALERAAARPERADGVGMVSATNGLAGPCPAPTGRATPTLLPRCLRLGFLRSIER